MIQITVESRCAHAYRLVIRIEKWMVPKSMAMMAKGSEIILRSSLLARTFLPPYHPTVFHHPLDLATPEPCLIDARQSAAPSMPAQEGFRTGSRRRDTLTSWEDRWEGVAATQYV